MARTADYTIQGFLYQFNKSLLTLLESPLDAEVTIEGIVEDIEINLPSGLTAIQCKYHETKSSFAVSDLYKPLLQMMCHFHENPAAGIRYILFAHFSGSPNHTIVTTDLEAALSSTNKDLQGYIAKLHGKIDLAAFLTRFTLQFGGAYDELVDSVSQAFIAAGYSKADVAALTYPNSIHMIGSLSIKHDVLQRKITKRKLLHDIDEIKTTTLSRWTLALKSRAALLKARRNQLHAHLNVNTRHRHLFVHSESIADFEPSFVGFVCDFIVKYHSKRPHIHTPLLYLDIQEPTFREIQYRLHQKGIVTSDGFVGSIFDPVHFWREPMIIQSKGSASVPQREFHLRIVRSGTNDNVISRKKPDDMFILGKNVFRHIDTRDINVEIIEDATIKEIAYLFQLSETYE